MPMPESHTPPRHRCPEHVHPRADRARMILRMNEIDRPASDQLLGGPTQQLAQRVVYALYDGGFILVYHRQPGPQRRGFLKSGQQSLATIDFKDPDVDPMPMRGVD